MRKLILGIVAVICAQITFQIFVAIDRADADNRARIEPAPLVAPVIDVAELAVDEDVEQIEAESTRPNAGKTIAHQSMPQNSSTRVVAYDRRARRPMNSIRSATMMAMVQTPPRLDLDAPTTSRDPRNAHLVTKEVPHARKRSFFSKVLPVIKKPYDWLKTVASNLK